MAELVDAADRELLRVKAERDFDRRRHSREFPIPEAPKVSDADPFAGLDQAAESAEPAAFGWRLWSALVTTPALAVPVVAAWLAAPLMADPALVRSIVTAAAIGALVVPWPPRRVAPRARSGWAGSSSPPPR